MPDAPVPPSAVPEPDDQAISFWVTYEAEEVNEGYWLIYREMGLPVTMISVFCSAFAIGVGGIVANFGSFEPINGLILIALAGFVFPPVLCLYAYMLMRGRLSKSYEARPNFHFPMRYTLSAVGCQVEYASGAGLLDWHHFTLAIETPSAFCLASSIEDVFVLPKRCLAGESDIEKVRDLVKSRVREFRRARGRQVKVAFERAAAQDKISEGINRVVQAAEEAERKAKGLAESGAAAPNLTGEAIDAVDEKIDVVHVERSEDSPALHFDSPLKTGLAVEISYLPGEIFKAEKIYFFRKRIIALATLYITYLIWMPLSFLAIGYIWGMIDYCRDVLNQVRPLLPFILPLFFFQAGLIFMIIRRRTKLNEDNAVPFVFQFTEEGCGVRAGERYAVLAWWHFRECWETEEQFLVLVGQRGHAMYVIPKRVFPDQAGLRYLQALLQRKIPKYRDLMG